MELGQYPGLYNLLEVLGYDWALLIEQTDALHTLVHQTLPNVYNGDLYYNGTPLVFNGVALNYNGY
jgi:hypothetical protein